MAEMCCTRHDANRFSFHGDSKLITTEASMLGPHVFSRVYDDACDDGFVIVAQPGKRQATFVVDRIDERDGEVRGWHLVPTARTLKQHPQLRGWRVLVVND